jgi:thiosulfate/3-mercaptopyruvate sulfurtransferase
MPSHLQSPPFACAFRQDLARARHLLTPGWLAALIGGQAPEAAPAHGWLLFEVGCGDEPAFLNGHIPGARYLDTGWLEKAPLWNKVSDAELLQLLLDLGIRHDRTVLLYGRSQLAAARAAHLLLYAGVSDVRLLDGGWSAWLRDGLPQEAGLPAPYPAVASFGAPFPAHPEYLIDTAAAKALPAQPDGVLVSVRTWGEFIGETSGYSYIAARGEIPGALWGRAGDDRDVYSMSEFHHPDGTMQTAAHIQTLWRDAGIRPEQRVAFYCGTGWRASLAFFYAWLLGWSRISVYDGGWGEWSHDPANPVLCRAANLLSEAAL